MSTTYPQHSQKALAKWTVTDYHQMIAAGILVDRAVELLQGDIVEMSPEGPLHYFLADSGAAYLRTVLADRAYIRFNGPITLTHSEPEPDLAMVQPPRERYQTQHPTPPDIFWLIEIAQSSLLKDLEDKRRIYAAANIPEYWVIDVAARCLICFREPQQGDYQQRLELTQGNLSPLAFPTIALSVTRLLQGQN